jgi:hypothetical protein
MALTRGSFFRQGNILADDVAAQVISEYLQGNLYVVATHDCDLAIEPDVEIIEAKLIQKLGADSHGKTARRLHLEFERHNENSITVELNATRKFKVQKIAIGQPRSDISLNEKNKGIFQRWLAARYNRAAFPNNFETYLDCLKNKIAALLKKNGEHIRGLFFDLDDGKNIERDSAQSPYQLGIVVLYDSSSAQAPASAKNVTEKLEELFENSFYSDKGWDKIALKYCDPVSDNVMTVAEQQKLKMWRLEYLSLKDYPPQPMISG